MRVACDTCGANYDIDESKVPPTGLAVKCAKCHHLFVIRPQAAQPQEVQAVELAPVEKANEPSSLPTEAGETQPYWTLKRPTGKTYSFRELATLQRWVVENKAARTDEISSDGVRWVRLDELPELTSFFEVVERATGSFAAQPAESAAAEAPATSAPPQPARPQMTLQMWAKEIETTADKPSPAALVPPKIQPANAPESKPSPVVVEKEKVEPAPKPVAIEETPASKPVEKSLETAAPVAKSAPVEPAAAPAKAAPPKAEPPKPAAREREIELGKPAKIPDAGPKEWKAPGTKTGAKESWSEWQDENADVTGKKRKTKIVLALVIILLLLAGAAVAALSSDKVKKYFKAGPSAEAVKQLQTARAAMNEMLPEKLTESEAALTKLRDGFPEYGPIYAALADVANVQVELAQYDIIYNEALQKRLARQIEEMNKVYDDMEKSAASDALYKQIRDQGKQLEEANANLEKANQAFNTTAKKAFELVRRAKELAPDGLETLRTMADYYRVGGGNASKATEAIEAALAKSPNDAETIFVKGALFAQDHALLANAAQTLQQAIQADPSLIKARIRLAHVLKDLDKRDEAKKEAEAILAKSPNFTYAKHLLSELAPAPDAKKEAALPVPEMKPGAEKTATYDDLYAMAERLRKADKAKEALGYYTKAAKQRETADVFSGMGYCNYDGQNFKGAVEQFKKALAKNPRHEDALMGIGNALESSGDKAEAVKYYQKYLDNYPASTEAKVIQGKIEKLK